jgi:hypothetical protein
MTESAAIRRRRVTAAADRGRRERVAAAAHRGRPTRVDAIACRGRRTQVDANARRGVRLWACAIVLFALSSPAHAQRPALAGENTFGVTGGDVLVHYATTGVDAVPMADANVNGVPDFVDEVAATAELALDHYLALGFRRPAGDGALGGDGRIDLYLRNLNAADGNTSTDDCSGTQCSGYMVAENDYARFGYPSVTEGIRSVVPHELFHLVQNTYSSTQPSTWTEGSAVWAVENLYGDGNSDFERFLPAFVTRSFRPFERPVGGFGDSYPYGAALWPYFLEHRYGVDLVVSTWAGCETAGFLDAANGSLARTGGTVDEAWIDFTRWNLFTGPSATRGEYPAAGAWPSIPREPAISDHGTIYVEGVSARYVPITSAAPFQITLSAPTIKIAAWIVADDGRLADGIDLAPDGATLSASAPAGSYTLVVTGLSRNSITTAVDVALGPPDSGGGGCSSSATPPGALLVLVVWFVLRRRQAVSYVPFGPRRGRPLSTRRLTR